MGAVIEAHDVRKSYGSSRVLDGIDLSVGKGRIVGLVGPNGAGKTTLLKGILGLAPVEGHLSVLGLDPRKQPTQLLEHVSFMADTAIMPRWLRVAEAIRYMSDVHPRFDRSRAEVFLARTDIKAHSKVRELSKGMLTQLHLALIMAIDSQLLVLDEPTLGLDILYRRQFYANLLDDYFDHEKTILITTHQIEEIENLLTDVVFLHQGRVCLSLPMDTIQHRFIELLVEQNNIEQAMALGPIACRSTLGGKAFIFEKVPEDRLRPLGRVSIPGLAELFAAKVEQSTEQLRQEATSHA